MKILLSAFACAPNAGSEGGVGWRWATELARQHQVVVITDVTRRAAIEKELSIRPVDGLHFVFFRPGWLGSIPLNSTSAQMLYMAWQFWLLPFANRLHRQEKFDVAMHVTYSVFRHPSFLGFLGIPFCFGPLGGGEDAPFRLKRSIKGREKSKEILRTVVNKLALFDPFLWAAYSRASLTLTSTGDTRRALPWPYRKRAVVYPNLGFDPHTDVDVAQRAPGQPLRLLFVGRLLGWKGAHFAIRAVARCARAGTSVEFTLLGTGPFEKQLRRVAQEEGVEQQIRWIAGMPQHELFNLYLTMHCLLFPSLHDSGGSVVLEAQAHGLPVICLDLGGPATLVTQETALVIKTGGLSEDQLVHKLAGAIELLALDDARRTLMSKAAIAHAGTMTWSRRVEGAMALFKKTICADGR